MMDYEMFKEIVSNKIKDYLGEDFRDIEIKVRPIDKVNCSRDGITFFESRKGTQVSPSLYINDLYEQYKRTDDLESTLRSAADTIMQAREKGEEYSVRLEYDRAKDNIIFQLINTEQNHRLLDDVPHRSFQDLSIIYRWVVDTDRDSVASSIVHNSLAKQLGMTEEDLFKAASENTKRIMSPTIRTMSEVMRDIFTKDGMPDSMIDMLVEEMPDEMQMYIIGNERGLNGAISMLYEDGLHKLSEKIGTDLYILPSSVHEVIAVSTNMGEPEELAKMVTDINMSQVSLEDRLSNQVYHYDKDLRKLTLATDTPNKRIDGIAAEPKLIYENKEQSR